MNIIFFGPAVKKTQCFQTGPRESKLKNYKIAEETLHFCNLCRARATTIPQIFQIILLESINLLIKKLLKGKIYQNNSQKHDFLQDLKIPHFSPCYVAAEKRAGISDPVKNYLCS